MLDTELGKKVSELCVDELLAIVSDYGVRDAKSAYDVRLVSSSSSFRSMLANF